MAAQDFAVASLEGFRQSDPFPDARVHKVHKAENKPGHKAFVDYKLPAWVHHPIKKATEETVIQPEHYMHAAGDGMGNLLHRNVAHVAALYGDMALLKTTKLTDLSSKNRFGETPAHYAVLGGNAWVLQHLVEHKADVTSPAGEASSFAGKTPRLLIQTHAELEYEERKWLDMALEGDLTGQQSVKCQEFKITRSDLQALPDEVLKDIDRPEFLLKMRKWHYNTLDWEEMPDHLVPHKPPPVEESRMKRDLPMDTVELAEAARREPDAAAALLFPGAASCYVGMLRDASARPAVAELVAKASRELGFDVQVLALEGPETELLRASRCWPLAFVAAAVGLELLKDSHPAAHRLPQAVAGVGVGEIVALLAAGVLSFELGLRLASLQGAAIEEALTSVPQASCTIVGIPREKVEVICIRAKRAAEDDCEDEEGEEEARCQIASSLFPCGFVCAGTKRAIENVRELAEQAGALQAQLVPGGGAEHTKLMKPAADRFAAALDKALSQMSRPRCPVYFNRTGKKVGAGTEPCDFAHLMKEQLRHEVLWEKTIKSMIRVGIKDFYEVGPQQQLTQMLKRIDHDASQRVRSISV